MFDLWGDWCAFMMGANIKLFYSKFEGTTAKKKNETTFYYKTLLSWSATPGKSGINLTQAQILLHSSNKFYNLSFYSLNCQVNPKNST